MTGLQFRAYGTPVPQGSKNAFVRGKRAVLVEASKTLPAWRKAVTEAAESALRRQGVGPVEGPVGAAMTFYLPRPKGHYGTGRNAGELKPGAPRHPSVKPDLDKLVRAVGDAISKAEAWADDSRLVSLYARKEYASSTEPAGVSVVLSEVPE